MLPVLSRTSLQNCLTTVVTTKNSFHTQTRLSTRRTPTGADIRLFVQTRSEAIREQLSGNQRQAAVRGCDHSWVPPFLHTLLARYLIYVKEKYFWVHPFRIPPDCYNSIEMVICIEDCLHIAFEYNKIEVRRSASLLLCARTDLTRSFGRYNRKDVIVRRTYFLFVRIKIKQTELSITHRDTTGSPPINTTTVRRTQV